MNGTQVIESSSSATNHLTSKFDVRRETPSRSSFIYGNLLKSVALATAVVSTPVGSSLPATNDISLVNNLSSVDSIFPRFKSFDEPDYKLVGNIEGLKQYLNEHKAIPSILSTIYFDLKPEDAVHEVVLEYIRDHEDGEEYLLVTIDSTLSSEDEKDLIGERLVELIYSNFYDSQTNMPTIYVI